MKAIARFLVVAFVSVVPFLCGCSPSVWVRVFNFTDHAIVLRFGAGKKTITVMPGESDRVIWGSLFRDGNFGFVVEDRGFVRFYDLGAPALLPHAARKASHHANSEYFAEYSSDGLIFVLEASDLRQPRRLNPQPSGFPKKPNKSPEPTPTAVTPRASDSNPK